jgi:hypothetical protein
VRLAALGLLASVAACGKSGLAPTPSHPAGGATGASARPSTTAGGAGGATPDVAAADGGENDEREAGGAVGIDAVRGDATDAHDAAREVGLYPSDAGVLPPERYRALTVVAGRDHMCALLDDHRVKCWGDNTYGQLGLGDSVARIKPEDMGDRLPTVDLGRGRTAKAIAAGHYRTCAILDDDSVKCWGETLLSSDPPVATDGFIGNAPGEMGDALAPLDLGPGRKARLLAVGYYPACVVRDDESVRCWYSTSSDYPPSPGHHVAELIGAHGVLELFDGGTLAPLPGGINGGNPPSPDLTLGPDVRVIAVAASRTRTCVVWANGSARCDNVSVSPWWPAPLAAEVSAVGVIEQSSDSCGIIRDGHVFCPTATTQPWNNGDPSPFGSFVRLGQPALAITGGSWEDFCAVLLDGEVKCWGSFYALAYYDRGLGGTTVTATDWPSVDLGTRPAP